MIEAATLALVGFVITLIGLLSIVAFYLICKES